MIKGLFRVDLLKSMLFIGLAILQPQSGLCETDKVDRLTQGVARGSYEVEKEENKPELRTRHEYYYFSPEKVGAAAFYNPVSMVVEGGLGGLYNKRLSDVQWKIGARELWTQLSNPVDAVSQYGTKDFFYHEFVPHIGKGRNFAPNYVWHLVGGGFRNKLMEEYYRYNGYSYPKTMAWLTLYSMHFLNEIVQAEHFHQLLEEGGTAIDENRTVDALPDLLFYDWVGAVIFSFDSVNRLASSTFHLSDWSSQTQLNPVTGRLQNSGQLYWARINISGPFGFSVLTGEQISTFNLSMDLENDYQLSIGTGFKPKTFHVEEGGKVDADSVALNFGIYLSMGDSPIVVATYEMADDAAIERNPRAINEYTDKAIINVYPGLFDWFGFKPGLTFSYQKDAYFFGASVSGWPVGLIFSTPQEDKYINAF